MNSLDTNLSAIDLEKIEAFTQKFSIFSNKLIKNMTDEKTRQETVKTLQKSFTEAQSYTPPDETRIYTHVDLFDFLNKILQNSKNEELKSAVNSFNKPYIIIKSEYRGEDVKNSQGISIMFITNYDEIDEYHGKTEGKSTSMHVKEYYGKSEFAKKTSWDKVQELYNEYSKNL